MIETGADHGMWTFQRYQRWLDSRRDWHVPSADATTEPESEPEPSSPALASDAGLQPALSRPKAAPAAPGPVGRSHHERAIDIEPVAGGLAEVVKKLAK